MNWLATTLFTGVIAINLAGKPNQGAKVAQNKGHNQPAVAAALIHDDAGSPDASDGNETPPPWYASPEWWLVFLGFPTLVILAWQARESRRAVQAAQRTIETVDGENRPWLLVEFGEHHDRIGMPCQISPDIPAVCTFYIKNYGRRPAKLLLVKADLVVGTSPKSPPHGEIVETEKRFIPQILPQGESIAQHAMLPVSAAKEFGEALNYHKKEKFLWLRGVITYEHTITAMGVASYRTEFSYVFEVLADNWQPVTSEAT